MRKYVILIADDSETHLSLAKDVLTADNYIIFRLTDLRKFSKDLMI